MKLFERQFSLISLMLKRRKLSELVKINIEIILGYQIYFLSFLFPRNKNKWVIGSHIGFAGNSKYFFIYTITEENKKMCYWIASSRKEAQIVRNLGLPSYYKWSVVGLYHLLTAKIYIFSSHLTDINFFTSGNAKRINFWHGVGIKKIEFELSIGSGKKVYDEKNLISRIYLPQIFKKPHFFLVTSSLMKEHFKQCFKITDKECFECGYPRNDIFYWNKKKLKTFIKNYEIKYIQLLVDQLENYNQSYMYMPTWRENRRDFIDSSKFDFVALNSVLKEKNELFLLKLHPTTNLNIKEKISNILIIDKNIDIYPILPFTNILITDYSSIYYDYLLLKDKNIILFPFDYNDYILNNRELAFDYNQYTHGNIAYTFHDLLSIIKNNDKNISNKERNNLMNLFWSYSHTNSSKLIFKELNLLFH
jgi:CDP-glycerol glycerophosphotransferase (TagB/SpsB family)